MNAKTLRILSVFILTVVFAAALGRSAQAGASAPTSVTISSDGPSIATHWTNFYVTVHHQAKPALTGQVCFTLLMPNTLPTSWSCKTPDLNGKASFTSGNLDTGDYVVLAKYNGDLLYQPSDIAQFTQHVAPIQSVVSIGEHGTTNFPLTLQQPTLYVLVTAQYEPFAQFPGQVALFENGQQIATAKADASNAGGSWHGIAWFTLNGNLKQSKGSHVLTAAYISASKDYTKSTSLPVSVTVAQ